jgi:hypothetical protein
LCSRQDYFADASRRFQNIIVPETQHAIALRLKPIGALSVVKRAGIGMLRSVKLNDDFARMPSEIRNIDANRCLPSEVHSQWLQRSQQEPQLSFGICNITPQGTRLRAGSLCNGAMRHR